MPKLSLLGEQQQTTSLSLLIIQEQQTSTVCMLSSNLFYTRPVNLMWLMGVYRVDVCRNIQNNLGGGNEVVVTKVKDEEPVM